MESEQLVVRNRPEVRRSGSKPVVDAPLFDIRGPNGEHWMLWSDGRVRGFAAGTQVLVNHGTRLEFLEVSSDPV